MGRLTLLCWNFEADGGADSNKRKEANRLLASLDPDLLFRQEMWGADAKGKGVMESMEEDLALRGWLGPSSHTAVFASRSLFSPVCGWTDRDEETIWKMPPTVRGLRFRPAGPGAVPLVCASYHHNYASATQRHAEAEWATTVADKTWTTPTGMDVNLPALLGGDHNSYPVPGADGGPPAAGPGRDPRPATPGPSLLYRSRRDQADVHLPGRDPAHREAGRRGTPHHLSREQRALVPLIAQEMTAAQMATALKPEVGIIRRNGRKLLMNLRARNRAHAITRAWQYQILTAGQVIEWLR
ncbi:endonuclease/exonuclease/phosphatase family protein [Streptomyces lydicus]|uniref:endonuclease/exonuclease/phosphatase family protein n=1 Tax=Streptomyces lydicus TaxID=47763 RepID=UPI0037B8AD78